MQISNRKKNDFSIDNHPLGQYKSFVDTALDNWLPTVEENPTRLHQAMRYAVFGQSKRIRPALVYATGQMLGIDRSALDVPAVAVEMIHTYSLIHDDLPAMDDDDLRRGRLTCHKEYDEATAILAGDSLQALAFHVLAHAKNTLISNVQRLKMIDTLAYTSGSQGMAAGQANDLAAVGKQLNIKELEDVYRHKTGMLIYASVKLSTFLRPYLAPDLEHGLIHYAKCIGLAFQIQDDILDVEGDTYVLGKRQGSDLAKKKPTYPGLLGIDKARDVAKQLHEEAVESLSVFAGKADILRDIADYIIQRSK